MGRPSVTRADAGGGFTLGFRDPGLAALRIVSEEHGEAVFTDVPIGSDAVVELLVPLPVSLSGTVAWADGRPGADLVVGLTGRFSLGPLDPDASRGPHVGTATRYSCATDEEGRYRFAALAPNVMYVAEITGETGDRLSFEQELGVLAEGESETWDYVIGAGMSLSGRVTGEQTGRPQRSLYIACMLGGVLVAQPWVEDDGTYSLQLHDPGTYFVFPEYNSSTRDLLMPHGQEVHWAAGEARVVDFQIPDHFTLAIRAVDLNGEPVAGAEVSLCRLYGGSGGSFGLMRTRANGECIYADFAPNLESWFEIEKPGYVTCRSSQVVGEPGRVYPEETVILHRSCGLEGVALDASGAPMGNGKLALFLNTDHMPLRTRYHTENGMFFYAETDESGAFALAEGFPEGIADLAAATLPADAPQKEAIVEAVEFFPGQVTNVGEIVFSG